MASMSAGKRPETTRQCSLCGATPDLEESRLECVAKTTWETKDDEDHEEYSDPRVWLVALCRPCRVKSYLGSLQSRIRLARGFIIAGIVLSILTTVDIWLPAKILPKGLIWDLLIDFLGPICLIGGIWSYIANRTRLALTGDLREIPPKRRSQAFMNAGETILERLQTGQGGTVYGKFPLPVLPEAPESLEIQQANLVAEKIKQERLLREIKVTEGSPRAAGGTGWSTSNRG